MQTEFTQVPNGTTLEQAAEMSKPGYVATERAGDRDGEVMMGGCMLGDDGTDSLSAD